MSRLLTLIYFKWEVFLYEFQPYLELEFKLTHEYLCFHAYKLVYVQVCASQCSPDTTADVDVDCMLSEWSNWSGCSETCGDGQQVRQRMVKRPAQGQGRACSDDRKEMRACNEESCNQPSFSLCMVSRCAHVL